MPTRLPRFTLFPYTTLFRSGLARRAEGRAKREPARSASAIARSLKRRAKPKVKSIRSLNPSPCPLPEGEGDLPQLRFTFIHHATVGDATRGIPSNQNESRKANWTCRAVVAVLVYVHAVGLKRPEPVKTC